MASTLKCSIRAERELAVLKELQHETFFASIAVFTFFFRLYPFIMFVLNSALREPCFARTAI